MTRFYENLLGRRKGLTQPLSKALALQEAKRWLRNLTVNEVQGQLLKGTRGGKKQRLDLSSPATNHPFEHPHHWAAFILIGDPE
jgi:CHAT domain-containing protein